MMWRIAACFLSVLSVAITVKQYDVSGCMARQDDGTYVEQNSVTMAQGMAKNMCYLQITKRQEWTNYHEYGGEFIRDIGTPERTSIPKK